eukprot:scaffold2307_cov112-Pinguiococcus_pyrenoidosus.AAC.1
MQLGLPKGQGKLFGKLKSGEDVVLEDGTVIKAAECLLPEQPRVAIAIVDVEMPREASPATSPIAHGSLQNLAAVFHVSKFGTCLQVRACGD